MLQRFIERYQLWCEQKAEERRGKNPLTWLAILAVVLIGVDLYTAVTSHHVSWAVLAADALFVSFVVLYVSRSRFAWLIVPVFGIVYLLESPFALFLSPQRYSLRFPSCLFVSLLRSALPQLRTVSSCAGDIVSTSRHQGRHTKTSNQSMKPTAPWRNEFSVFATAPCRGLSLSR